MELLHKNVTEQIIGAAFEVLKQLGYGFLEAVYQRALKIELELRGLTAELESQIRVYYKGVDVGRYEADVLVNKCVIIEIKIAKEYQKSDEAQLLNELKATGIKGGLLINFGRAKAEVKRFVF